MGLLVANQLQEIELLAWRTSKNSKSIDRDQPANLVALCTSAIIV
jgi:hypothetical protein